MPHATSFIQSFVRLFTACGRPESEQHSEASFVRPDKTAAQISGHKQVLGAGALDGKFVRFVKFVAAKFAGILSLSSHKQNAEQSAMKASPEGLAIMNAKFKEGFSETMRDQASAVTAALGSLTSAEFVKEYKDFLSGNNAMRKLGCIFSNISKFGFKDQADALNKLDIGYGFSFVKAGDESLIEKMSEDDGMADHVLKTICFVAGETEAAFSEKQGGDIDVDAFCSKLLNDLKEKFPQVGSQMTESVAKEGATEECDVAPMVATLPRDVTKDAVLGETVSDNKFNESGEGFFFNKLTAEGHEREVDQRQPKDGTSAERIEAELLADPVVSDDTVVAKKDLPLPDPSNLLSLVSFKLTTGNPNKKQFMGLVSELQQKGGALDKLFTMFEAMESEGGTIEKEAAQAILNYKSPGQLFTMGQIFGSAKEQPISLANSAAVVMFEQFEKRCAVAVNSCKPWLVQYLQGKIVNAAGIK